VVRTNKQEQKAQRQQTTNNKQNKKTKQKTKHNRGVPAAHFKWHTAPITSVSWHPSEESVLAVAGADDQITIWDLSLEQV